MAGVKRIKASEGFARYVGVLQKRAELDTGFKYSVRDITAFIAATQPVIKIEMNGKKKRSNSIFDF